ncbi:MAG: pilus assembly protein CpaE [Cellulomonas sp.]
MISIELAWKLNVAGVRWLPRSGDRFTILQPELAGDVFTISDMMVEAHEFPTGTVLGFNGTTEWAMDSVAKDDALWLPGEDQLRALLGGTFRSLTAANGFFRVTTTSPSGTEHTFEADDASDAYAQALLSLVGLAVGSLPT